MKPDFIQIPLIILNDDKLQTLDKSVYGIVYWYFSMPNKKCIASNATIADILSSSASGVSHALSRLEERGYIKRIVNARGARQGIEPMVRYAHLSNGGIVDSNKEVSSSQLQNKKEYNKKVLSKDNTKSISLIELYKKIYTHYLLVKPELNYGKQIKLMNSLLDKHTKDQLAVYIIMHFNWRGANGDSQFIYKNMEDNCFPLEWLGNNIGKYQVYLKHKERLDLDNSQQVVRWVTDYLFNNHII